MKNLFLFFCILNIFSLSHQQSTLTDNLIHSYPLRENLENIVDPTLPASGYTIKQASDRHSLNQSFKFNTGVVDSISIPPETIDGLNDFTFSIWVYHSDADTNSKNACIFSAKDNSNGNIMAFCRWSVQVNQYNYVHYDTSGSTIVFPNNQWFHYAAIKDNTQIRQYYDGQLRQSHTQPAGALEISEFSIGNYKGSMNMFNQLVGRVQDFRIYNSVKSVADILTIRGSLSCHSTFLVNTSNNPNTCDPCVYPCLSCEISVTQCINCVNPANRKTDTTCACLNDSFYDQSQACNPCNRPCLTCSDSSTCTSCKGLNRQNIATCICENGYYDNTTDDNCQQCPNFYKVKRCSSSTGTVIDECKTGTQRSLNTSESCGCNVGFYDNGTDLNCVQCPTPHKVESCTSDSSITGCKAGTQRTLNTSDCGCNIGYFDDNTNTNCQQCPNLYKVKSCTSTSSITECHPGTQRSMNTSDCGCNIGYYDDGSNIACIQCPTPYKVKSCSSNSVFTECHPGTQRSLNTSDCGCNTGYYDDGSNISCVQCPTPHKVESCSSGSNITGCKAGIQRTLNTSDCGCNIGYYDDNTNTNCLQCPNPYKVKSCTSSSAITECHPGIQRSMNTSDCGCNIGYYDDGSNIVCVQCPTPYKVKSCSSNTIFTECHPGTQRSGNTSDCGCNTGYYDDGSNIACVQCPNSYKVKSCSSDSNMTECKSGFKRSMDTSDCGCQDGYYDDGINIDCVECPNSYKVQKCTQSSIIQCKSGVGRSMNTSDCGCNNGYFDNGTDLNCQSCQYPCINCSSSSTCMGVCQTPTNRKTDSTCGCQNGFFDNGAICEECDYSQCITCGTSATDCINSCHEGCKLCNIQGECVEAKGGYLIDNSDGFLKRCDRECKTCENRPNQCIINCDQSCGLCNENGCETCNINSFLQTDNTCVVCPPKCFSCQNSSQCLSCNNKGIGRSLSLEQNCGCIDGYYEIDNQSDCEKCPVKNCKKCQEGGLCTECMKKDLIPPLCEQSNKGFLIDIIDSNNTSQKCEVQCLKCENSTSNCIQCIPGLNRSFDLPCLCITGFHDNSGTTNDCFQCPKGCKSCTSSDHCTSCEKNKKLNSFSNLCECPKEFKFNESTGLCERCFYFNGECLLRCPKNTVSNNEKSTCEMKSYQIEDSISLIWLSAFILILMVLLVKGIGILQVQKISKDNSITGIVSVEQN